MSFRIIKNMIDQGFQGMWRNRAMGLASVSSILAVLLILGLVLIMVLGINNVVMQIKAKFDIIQVYLERDLAPDKLENLENYLKESPLVESYSFESKDKALEKMKESWGDEGYLLDSLEDDNRLPDSFLIELKGLEYTDGVVEEIKELAGVEGVPYYKDSIDKLIMISKYIRLGGLAITVALVFVSIFIISNTIKLTVANRKREINIMKYVGATNGYIRGPFIIEGVLFGLIAAGLAILIINFGYEHLFDMMNDRLYYIMSIHLVAPDALLKDMSIIFLSIGAGIGAVGSIFSLKRYLNV